MLYFFRKLAVLIVVLGLPLQNMHASAMPLCDHDAQTAQVSEQHTHDGDVGEHHDHSQTSQGKIACDGCGMCHACSAPAVVGVAFEFSNSARTSMPISYSVAALSSFTDDHFRPPLAPVA